MEARVRSALTLVVLGVMLVVGGVWGWTALTEPLPDAAQQIEPPVCEPRPVDKGEKVFRGDVTVSVFNTSNEPGLAGETMDALVARGFSRGETGNAPADVGVRNVRIWADDKQDPAVRLVARHLGKPAISKNRGIDAAGVLVLVGPDFKGVSKGRKAVRAKQDSRICSPILN